MKNELTIRIAGEAGQGMQTIGAVLCRAFISAGLNVFANQDYMSRIRGGNNFFQLRVSGKPAHAPRRQADIIVALDKASVELHRPALAAGGLLVADAKKYGLAAGTAGFADVPLYALAAQAAGAELFMNSVACGFLTGATCTDFKHAESAIRRAFEGKPAEIISKNIAAAKAGYDFSLQQADCRGFAPGAGTGGEALLLDGNGAMALAAIKSGCKFYSAYPMSPSTGLMETLAQYAEQFGIAVEQAEDEIAAVNMAIGASFAGARAMTATSGGGFALMTEGISLAAMTETPVVIADMQRPAPATGFPTRTEQADLDFALHAGHGEFARAVFTPGTPEQAFALTAKAFDTAERYQIPVFILSDQHLAESYRSVRPSDLNMPPVKRDVLTGKIAPDYKRYALNDTGISPRALPGLADCVVYADSDEHTEEGHITEDAAVRAAMVRKRFHLKMAALARETEKPQAVGVENADIVLVGFGSTYGVMREAAESARTIKTGFIHLSQVWPFPAQEMEALLKNAKKAVTVENNAAGQLARLIRRETGIKLAGSILKFDGRPFDLDYLAEALVAGRFQ